MSDPVRAPEHYTQGGIECIDALRAALTPEGFVEGCKMQALQYIWREKHKGGYEDLEKAIVYLTWAIEVRRNEGPLSKPSSRSASASSSPGPPCAGSSDPPGNTTLPLVTPCGSRSCLLCSPWPAFISFGDSSSGGSTDG